jgi:hypothetical protein
MDDAPPPTEPTGHAELPAEERGPSDVWVSVLLTAAAVVAAALGGRAALLSDRGSDTYSASIRQHAKQAAATVEDIRYLFADEAGFALRATIAEVRAEELRRAAQRLTGRDREQLLAEASAQEQVAEVTRSASEAAAQEYRLEGGGFDLMARLADLRARQPDLVALDPDEPEEQASGYTKHAALAIAATIPTSLAFMFGALSQGFPRRRRPLLVAGFVALGVGLASGIALEVML